MYGLCKVHKTCVDGCPTFRTILSALQTPTYKLEKYLVSNLEPLTTNKFIVKNSFNLATEILEQNSSNFMGCLDIDLLFTTIPFEETIEICTKKFFKNNDIVHCMKKNRILYLIIYHKNN